MESLLKQTRLKFSGLGEASREHSEKERRIPPQKSRSFKEKKNSQNWLQRQFSRQTSQDFAFIDIEQATAVAAATYAVNSLEDSGATDPQKAVEDPQTPLPRTKSRYEGKATSAIGPGKWSKIFAGEPSLTDSKETKPDKTKELKKGKSLSRSPSLADRFSESPANSKAEVRESMPDQYTSEPKSALPKQPEDRESKPDQYISEPKTALTKQHTMKSEGELPKQRSRKPESNVPEYEQPTKFQIPPFDTQGQSSERPRKVKTKADAWEEEELARIKDRYEKLNATINEWESKKKEKASKKLNKKESELQRKRAKELEEFSSEIRRIDQIAGGARSQAEKRRIKEERKAKEKAKKMRTTGKVPKNCFCC